ncbi:LAFA_0F13322g1_1 [Lachancea sp. 'fantastica']|nr:LAFA_0F13322g1_1 [Lachancea sp. 'fantastica']
MGAEPQSDQITNKLELVAHLFIIYLGHCNLLADNANIQFREVGRKNIELQVSTNPEVASQKFKCGACDAVEVVLMDMSGGQKCMISVCLEERPIVHGIFNYDRDFFNSETKVPLPVAKSSVSEFYTPNVDTSLEGKFRLRSGTSKRDEPQGEPENSNVSSPDYAAVHQRLERLKFGNPPLSLGRQSTRRRSSISDMPRFDDEYEINRNAGIPVTGEFGVPGLASGYGDQDLYPTGQKYPNLQDPSQQFPGATNRPPGPGGMTFDPFRGNATDPSSNPLRGDPNATGGPKPPFPGARFDDPFGRPDFHGGGGGFV